MREAQTATVVNLDNYRQKDFAQTGQHFSITFFGVPFIHDDTRRSLSLTFNVHNGNPHDIINEVKVRGGAFLEGDPSQKEYWFMPWPCAAIRIAAIDPEPT
jgi:hypothetical protein